jgi:hypothetical protein
VDPSSSSVLETPVPELTPDDTAADFYEKSKRNRIQSVTSKSYMGLIATRRFRRIIVNSY